MSLKLVYITGLDSFDRINLICLILTNNPVSVFGITKRNKK